MSVFNIYKKEEHLQRAVLLLKSDLTTDHVYACLELRFCIEAIVYQKLLYGIKNIPNSIVETWQPHKAIKMLLDIDEFMVTDCKIEFNLSKTDMLPEEGWLTLGEQKIPPVRWLSKNYNKLGSFLHLVEPKKAQDGQLIEIKNIIAPIAKKLEEYVKGDLVVTVNNIEINQCPVCGQDFAFLIQKMKHGDIKKCSNFKCGALLSANMDGDSNKLIFSVKTFDFPCLNCDEIIVVPEIKIRNLDSLSCQSCNSKFVLRGSYELALLTRKADK